jgi:2-amino-4-hydroxy-6-hydroxymethyldihydropteridine diphosphokinase
MRTGVALGSNIGDRLTNLDSARKAIAELPGVATPLLSSPVYETDPIGCEPGAAKFLNAVVEFEYRGDLAGLLEELIRIEESLGRKRDHTRNISRKIDLDLLYSGDAMIETDELQVPHPRTTSREFVLRPLADISPKLVLPGQTKTAAEILAELPDSAKVTRFQRQW